MKILMVILLMFVISPIKREFRPVGLANLTEPLINLAESLDSLQGSLNHLEDKMKYP